MNATALPSIVTDVQLTPNARTVLRHLERRGSITPLECMNTYGFGLAGRIHELRHKARYVIRTVLKTDEAGTRYARYYLG